MIAENVALGVESNVQYKEADLAWEIGDTLIMTPFSFGATEDASVQSKDSFKKIVMEYYNQSMQNQADNILRKAKMTAPRQLSEHPICLISIHRQS